MGNPVGLPEDDVLAISRRQGDKVLAEEQGRQCGFLPPGKPSVLNARAAVSQ
jgi:hypothetical protein